jgi:hypothetical protein
VWFLHRLVAVCGFAFLLTTVPAGALAGPWSPPVSGPVVRGFDPPDSPFGPGHLGVDYAVAPGTAVRAAGAGVVVFAGRVGEGLHVVVRHDGDVRTTDSFLATIEVVAGQTVGRGAILGTSGGTGPGHGAAILHFGVRVGATPVDPMLLFAPPDLSAVVHLAAPRGGAAAPAPADPSRSGSPGERAALGSSVGERAALAAELRVDARQRAAPPAWWHDQPETRPRAPAGAAEGRRPTWAPSRGGAPVTAPLLTAGGVVVVGLGAAQRRRARRRR